MREKVGGGRSCPQFRLRGSSMTCLVLKGKPGFSGTRSSSDCEASGGVFSLLRDQSALVAPREYNEQAEPLRAVMSLSGASSVSF
jgi:hypothetical protein